MWCNNSDGLEIRPSATALSVSYPCLVFVQIFRKIMSGFCLLSGFYPDFLSGFCLSRFCMSRFCQLSGFCSNFRKKKPAGQGRDRAIRTFTVLIRRRLIEIITWWRRIKRLPTLLLCSLSNIFYFVLEMKFFGNFKNSIHVMKQWLFDTFGIFKNVKFNKNGIRIKSMNNMNLFYAFEFHKNDFSGLSGLGWRGFDDFWTRTTILYISKSRKVRSRVGKFHRSWKCLFPSSTNGIETRDRMESFHY